MEAQSNESPYIPIPLSEEEKTLLAGVDSIGYYRENIFQLEEMYLYRSVFNLYVGNYEESIADLNRSWKSHFQSTQQAKKDLKSTTNKAGKNFNIDTEFEEDDEMLGKFSASQLVSPINSVIS